MGAGGQSCHAVVTPSTPTAAWARPGKARVPDLRPSPLWAAEAQSLELHLPAPRPHQQGAAALSQHSHVGVPPGILPTSPVPAPNLNCYSITKLFKF